MRPAITILAIGIGLAVVAGVVFNKNTREPARQHQETVVADAQEAASHEKTTLHNGSAKPVSDPQAPLPPRSGDTVAETVYEPIDGLHAVEATEALVSRVGSLAPNSGNLLEAELTGWGAAVRYVRLAKYTQGVDNDDPYVIQQPVEAVDANGNNVRLYPFAARTVVVNGTRLALEGLRWELTGPGVYRMTIADAADRPVLTITRRYKVNSDNASYDLYCDQTMENLCGVPLQVTWEQYAQGDTPMDSTSYMGDRRMLAAGYYDLDYNPSRQFVYTKGAQLTRQHVIDGQPFWHQNDDLPANRELVWVAAMNRYFAVAVHPVVTMVADANGKLTVQGPARALDSVFDHVGIQVIGQAGGRNDDNRVMAFTLTSKPLDLAPQQSTRLDLAVYAGPRKGEVFDSQPYASLGFGGLLVYDVSCSLCTFQPLAKGLLWFLKLIHAALFDWGVAIIILVLCVRLVLHPITKRAQINMFKMSKQMQTMQPEIEKLKKKYKDDQQKFQQEQLKLWREKGVNPMNMLGCLPMFLQMPIWIALYSMLYMAIELRHEPAFYGLFQTLSGGQWGFLADLSSPDNFIRFAGEGFTLNLIFVHPKFASINLLPILMAGVFYVQQKFTTPPPANEQAAQQQKMMKFMVLLFPIFLYSAPSGLTLYILASTFAGIIDSYIVRKHVKQQEEAGTLLENNKKPPKPGGFMDRMQKAMEAKQQQMAQQKTGGQSKGKRKRK